VVALVTDKQTKLQLKNWDPIMEEIGRLKGKNINLTDYLGYGSKETS